MQDETILEGISPMTVLVSDATVLTAEPDTNFDNDSTVIENK